MAELRSPSSFQKLGGTSRRYIDLDTGGTVSYRQFHRLTTGENFGDFPLLGVQSRIYSKEYGVSVREARKAVPWALVHDYARTNGLDSSSRSKMRSIRRSQGFKDAIKGLLSNDPRRQRQGAEAIFGTTDRDVYNQGVSP